VSETGRYDILKSEGDKLVLELYNRNGSVKAERTQIAVTINQEANTIKIGRAGPFTRDVP
jgi:D-lyxose ketol-isomerase